VTSTRPPGGTRDFLADEIRRREHVIGVIREVYERYGFEPLETPALENVETLLGKYGEESNKLIFKILRRGEHEATGEADLALRYDLTVPLARVVAQYQNEVPKFLRRYQIQPVWRADRPARGRFREFYQCDIDAIGSTSPIVDVEILTVVAEALGRLGFADFEIRLNHRRVLAAILGSAGIGEALHESALVALDKLDKIGPEGVGEELASRRIGDEARKACLQFFQANDRSAFAREAAAGSVREASEGVLARLRAFAGRDAAGGAAVDELETIVRLALQAPVGRRIRVDPSLARGLSYYTGAIMEVAVPDLAGSLGGGGRYDHLIGAFLGRDVPACGFSLGLERIIVVMAERGMFPVQVSRAGVDVMVALWGEAFRADALSVAAELRGSGLRVDVYPDPDRIGKQFKYASSRHVPFVAVVGDDERAAGTVSIKNMHTGEQVTIGRADAARHVRSGIQS
jgi:histidyl-tRNA synthetase